MGLLRHLVLLSWMAVVITAPPVTQKKPGDPPTEPESEDQMEYHHYLKEVVAALESDPEFRDKLEKAAYVDIRSGKIAHELDFVNHNVRTKLDEIKRAEMERLRHLMAKQHDLANDIDTEHVKVSTNTEHLDHDNPHTFEIDDLKKLILKTAKDLEEADKQRKKEFKEYEMQKEFEKKQKIETLDEVHRKEYEKELHEKEEKHKNHQPLHHPGSRQQLEEVWEKQDHMQNQQFDPKIFFMLHDVDSNGVWDQNEVKALFLKELDKMYENGAPEDDMRERQEEMERMREHVFHESDTNRDGFISYEEFLVQTRKAEFNKDPGWKGLDEEEVYSPEEYQEFERNRLEEVQRLIQQGMIPPQPIYDPGMQPHQQYPYGNQIPHPAYQQQQYHPNAIPQGQPQQYHPNAVPHGQSQQYHPNAVPQGQPQQYHPNAVPQQYHPNAVPQGQPQQYHPDAAPQQYSPGAAPQVQPQFNPNGVPQGEPNAGARAQQLNANQQLQQQRNNQAQPVQHVNVPQQSNTPQQPQQKQIPAADNQKQNVAERAGKPSHV